jgi:nitrite reductase (NADH) large subunit
MDVTVVHVMPWLMERQLDDVAGKLLQKSLEERGLKFLLGAQTQDLSATKPAGSREGRKFKDGTEVEADLVVMAVGIRPNTELAEKAACICNRGIVVNDTMQTVTTRASTRWANARRTAASPTAWSRRCSSMAKVAANHLAQFGIGRYTGSVTSTKLKVTGIDLFSAGDFMGGDGTEEIVMSDPFGGVYKKLVIKDDKLVGACLYGDTVDGSWYFKLLREGRSVRHPRPLMFGPAPTAASAAASSSSPQATRSPACAAIPTIRPTSAACAPRARRCT